MRSFRRVTQRVASIFASVASLLLFATCDFDKISGTPTPLTQQDIDRIFSITPVDTTITLGATKTLTVAPGTGVTLAGTTTRWFSSSNQIISIDSVTGLASGVGIGNATITARILAPELDTGYSKTRQIRVRYKAIRMAAMDSIPGKNMARAVVVNGTNNSDQLQQPALTGATLSVHDSGSTNSTVAQISGTTVVARNNGIAYVVALFDSFRDSAKVKVRQVAKSLLFPSPDYVATSLNANRTLPINLRDVNDSVMTSSPVMTWSSSDTSVVKINPATGVFRVVKVDTARIHVRVDTINKSQKVVVNQIVTAVSKAAGDLQTDTVGRFVTALPEVTVMDEGGTAIANREVTFSVLGRGFITDSVKMTDAAGKAALGSWRLSDTVGVHSVKAAAGTASAIFTATAVHARPFGLRFTLQPSVTGAGVSMAPAIKVTVIDSLGNVATSATNTVTIAIANNPSAGVLSGTVSRAAVDGVATFDDLKISAAGNGYTLSASATGLANTVSDAFGVFGAATKLGFEVQPSNATVNTAIKPPIKVAIQDAAGSTVTTSTAQVTLAIGTNPGSAVLAGTKTVAAVDGIAIFSDLALDAVANGYTLTATATGLTSATSGTFNVRAVGSATRILFTQEPGNVTAGQNISPSIQAEVVDANGARVITSTSSLGLYLLAPTGTKTFIASSSTPAGLATWGSVAINQAAAGYRVIAETPGLIPDTSDVFTVSAAQATKLGFVQGPTHVNPGVAMTPAVTVAVQDAFGNTVTTAASANVALALSGGSGVTLGGTTTQATSGGIATFNNLTISGTATGMSLTASSAPLANGASSQFNSVALSGGVKALRFVSTPANAIADNAIGSVQVELIDANGARVTGAAATSISISIASGPGVFSNSTTSATTSSGVATFSNLRIQTAGTYTLRAAGTGFASVTSNSFNVTAGTATRIGFLAPIGSVFAGAVVTPAIRVGVLDSWDNVVPTATSTITLSYGNNPFGAAALAGTLSRATVQGVATFDNISMATAGTGYQLQASNNSGFTTVFTNTFEVVAGTPVALGFAVQPSASVGAGSNFSPAIAVRIQDAGGNAVASASTPVTIALTGGDATAVLSGTKTVTPVDGVATFTGITVDKPGTGYRLNASASGFSTVSSNLFNVTIGAASQLRFKTQPVNSTGGGSMSVVVELIDAAGNLVTTDSRTVSLSIESGTGTAGAAVSGTTSISASSGVATFNNVSVDKVGTGYKLRATASGVTFATSNAFNITQGPAAKLVFTEQPTQINGGGIITPAVKVSITDQGGNLVNTATNSITLTKQGGNSSASLSGTLTQAAVAGVATFSNLSIDRSSNGYQLVANSTGLAAATSSSFNVIVGPPAKLLFTFVPTSVTSASDFSATVAVTDAGGNTISTSNSDIITLSVKTGPAGHVFGGSGAKTRTVTAGSASFSQLQLDKAGTYELQATSGSLTAGNSGTFTVSAGSLAKVAWTTQPAATFINAPLVPSGQLPQLTLQDASGNTVTNNNTTVRISIGVGPATSFRSGSSTVSTFDMTPVLGVATIPNTVSMTTAGNFSLAASLPFWNAFTVNSSSFSVSAFDTKAKLGYVQGPPATTGYGVSISPSLTVAVQDQYGNTVTTASDAVSLAIGTDGNTGTTLTGGGASPAASGIATFAGVSLDRTGTGFTLVASSGTLTSATSSSFTVSSPGLVASIPQDVATGSFALAGGNLFWSDNAFGGSIRKVSANGGTQAAVTTLPSTAVPGSIVTDGVNIYWTEDNSGGDAIKRTPVSGGAVETVVSATNLIINSLSLDATNNNLVYVAQQQAGVNYAIKRVAKTAISGTPTDIIVVGSTDPKYAIATSGGVTTVYYYDPALTEMRSIPALGGAPVILMDNPSVPRAGLMRVAGSNLYWLNTSAALYSLPISGGSQVERIAASFCSAGDVQVDGTTSLYYRDGCSGLRKVNLTTFANTQVHFSGSVAGVTLDGSSVYFYHGFGNIYKAPK